MAGCKIYKDKPAALWRSAKLKKGCDAARKPLQQRKFKKIITAGKVVALETISMNNWSHVGIRG